MCRAISCGVILLMVRSLLVKGVGGSGAEISAKRLFPFFLGSGWMPVQANYWIEQYQIRINHLSLPGCGPVPDRRQCRSAKAAAGSRRLAARPGRVRPAPERVAGAGAIARR